MSELVNNMEQLENGTVSDSIIEIKSMYRTGTKPFKRWVQPAWNRSTSWWAGVERLTEKEKEGKTYFVVVGDTKEKGGNNTKVEIFDGKTFDLQGSIVDRVNWSWIKKLPYMATSLKEALLTNAEFYVHIEAREAEMANTKVDHLYKALQYIMEDPSTNYMNRALLLGSDMAGQPVAVVKQFLVDTAKQSPSRIEYIYQDAGMGIQLLYVQAKRDKVITVNESGVINFSKYILGSNEKAAIAFLQTRKDVLLLLERETNPTYFAEKQGKISASKLEGFNSSAEDAKSEGSNLEPVEPSYNFMKDKAKQLGHTGGNKKVELLKYFTDNGVSMEDMYSTEQALLNK